jgi:hypothetical protein
VRTSSGACSTAACSTPARRPIPCSRGPERRGWSSAAKCRHFADEPPTSRAITRRDIRPRGLTAAACRREGRVFCRPRMPLVRTWW